MSYGKPFCLRLHLDLPLAWWPKSYLCPFKPILLCIILLAFSFPTLANNQAIQLSNNTPSQNISEYIQFLQIKGDDYTLETVSEGKYKDSFKQNGHELYIIKENFKEYWLKFSFTRQPNTEVADYFLLFKGPPLFINEGYQISANGDPLKLHKDWGAVSSAAPLYKVSMGNSDRLDMYLRTNEVARSNYRIELQTASDAIVYNSTQFHLRGIFIGSIVIMFFYNIFIYIRIRERGYIYYSSFIVFTGLAFSSIDGTISHYLNISDQREIVAWSLGLFLIAETLYLLFVDTLLDIASINPKLQKVYQYSVLGLSTSFVLYFLTPEQIAIPLFYLATLFFAVFGFSSLLYLSIKKLKNASITLVAFMLPILFSTTSALTYFELAEFSQDFSIFSSKFSLMAAFALLSFVLASKFSSLREMNQNLQAEAISNLEASDRTKREFLSTISHELRTPMNGVKGSLELIKLESTETRIKPYLDTVDESAEHMMSMIDSILSFIDLESGSIKPKITRFNLSACVSELLATHQYQCKKKGLKFTYLPQLDHDTFYGDKGKTVQILNHLLDNAVKFCHEGSISLTIEERVASEGNLANVFFRIKDTGIGIPQDKHGEVFNLFSQADGSFSRNYGGLGIGLTITKELIETLGGKLQFSSEENVGSEFKFHIPMSPELNSHIESPAESLEEHLNAMDSVSSASVSAVSTLSTPSTPSTALVETTLDTCCVDILIVEDNKVNQKVLKALIDKLGYTSALCENGEEAVQWCQEKSSRLIFMDCQMPVMDGFEATRKIRASDHYNAKAPIIAVTANVSESDREKCQHAGMDDFLSKPVKKAMIASTLEKWLNSKMQAS